MDYQPIIDQLYLNFNARNIDAVLALMHTDVAWPNGWEGGYVSGHDEVCAYWLRQWQQIDPVVEPVSVNVRPDGQVAVSVHQIIKELTGPVISDSRVNHVYTFEDGKVKTMVIEHL